MQLEMMSDAIDETLDKDEAEEETEELTNQVKCLLYSSLEEFSHVVKLFSLITLSCHFQ
jgi:helix-turn-helix protein